MDWNVIGAAFAGSLMPAAMAWWLKHKTEDLHVLINSRMTELLEISKKLAAAEATLDAKAEQNGHKIDELVGAAKAMVSEGKK